MATFTITIPDPQVSRVLDALTARWGYDSTSGDTTAQFVKQHIKRWLKSEVLEQEGRDARDTAQQVPPPDIEVD